MTAVVTFRSAVLERQSQTDCHQHHRQRHCYRKIIIIIVEQPHIYVL